VQLAYQPTPHSLYTITIHTNQPVLKTIPTQHAPKTHKNTSTHKTLPTSHPSSHNPTPPAMLSSHSIHHHTHNHAVTSPRQPKIATQTPTQTHAHKHTPHSPKDDHAPTHTQPQNNPVPIALQESCRTPCSHCPSLNTTEARFEGPAVGIDPETSGAKHSSPAGERVCHCTLLLRKKAPQHTKVAHVCTRV
jgi:hypothetical protein